MAVVQISRIQLRRGKKNQGTGMPQLASGELAWAIDTQELFIGNGAISEGAPYVGNTKILTERDSIISIAGQYEYYFDKETGNSDLIGTVKRSIQSRLDEGIVNVKSFGIIPFPYPSNTFESIESQTAKLQNAIDEVSSKTEVTLEFDKGQYRFNSTINLPSNIKIKGQGKDSTVLYFSQLGNAVVANNGAENVSIKNLTLQIVNNNTTILTLQNNRNFKIDDVKFVFDDGTSVIAGNLSSNRVGIRFLGSNLISNNLFSNLEFSRLTYAAYSNSGSSFNTFTNCYFNNLYKGLLLGDNATFKSNYNVVAHSIFDFITQEAIEVINGLGNKSISNRFKNVGGSTFSDSSIIKFHSDKNSSIDDYFERQQFLQEYGNENTFNRYLPEVDGISNYSKNDPTKVTLDYADPALESPTAITLPLKNINGIKIDYVVNSLSYNIVRRGTMYIVIKKDTDEIELSDEFEVQGDIDSSIVFSGFIEVQSGEKVLRIKYLNSENFPADQNELSYTYSVLS